MSDDEDYMSDKFLEGTEKYGQSSLLYRHCDKREHELMKKKAKTDANLTGKKALTHIEEKMREEGLSAAITSSNKGFEMLMKMGYKPGQGIGKTESGIVEPIGVEVKANRHGLGKATKEKRKAQSQKPAADKLNEANLQDFRSRAALKKAEQLINTDLWKSQKVCEQLDMQLDIQEPRESWFWLPKPDKETEEDSTAENNDEKESEDDEESIPVNEQLEILTRYLRKKHYYCIWCGTSFNDEDDLKENCPGDTRSDH